MNETQLLGLVGCSVKCLAYNLQSGRPFNSLSPKSGGGFVHPIFFAFQPVSVQKILVKPFRPQPQDIRVLGANLKLLDVRTRPKSVTLNKLRVWFQVDATQWRPDSWANSRSRAQEHPGPSQQVVTTRKMDSKHQQNY